MNEVRELKVMFNKSGGNASKNSYAPKLSIPKVWLDKMNVTLDEREVKAKFDGSKNYNRKKIKKRQQPKGLPPILNKSSIS